MFVHLQVIAQNEMKTIATINGEPVAVGEFDLFASQNRSKVIQYFRINYNIEYSDKFWRKKVKGNSALELLKKLTFENLIELKMQQILAREYGIVERIDYEDFLEKLDAENNRRANKLLKSESVYGPVVYEKEIYFAYLLSNVIIQLKDKLLIQKVIKITGVEGRQVGLKVNMKAESQTEVSKFNNELNSKYDELIKSLMANSKLKINKTVLKNYFLEKNYY